jgi:hypothetical protein
LSPPEDPPEPIPLPDVTLRLFPDAAEPGAGEPGAGHPGAGDPLDPRAHAPHVIARVLEDGDRRDLAWLFGAYGRERLSAWLRKRGERQLSRRSRAFWRVILDADGDAGGDAGGGPGPRISRRSPELWPL